MLALHIAVQETLNIRNLLESIGIHLTGPTQVWCDNDTAVNIFNENASPNKTKHLDIRIHMVREAIKNKLIEVKWISTQDMVADILTKGLGRNLHQKHVQGLGIIEVDITDLDITKNVSSVKGSVKVTSEVTEDTRKNLNGITLADLERVSMVSRLHKHVHEIKRDTTCYHIKGKHRILL
jgi:hypothetical protein